MKKIETTPLAPREFEVEQISDNEANSDDIGGIFVGTAFTAYAKDSDESMEQMTHHNMMHMNEPNVDERVSLKLSPQMKQHQLL